MVTKPRENGGVDGKSSDPVHMEVTLLQIEEWQVGFRILIGVEIGI
jgi:hypothetical protein